MKIPLSVFIITKNEESRIARTIEAVNQWADEIIVVDSGSTDSTVEIAKSLGASVHFRDWTGYGPQKRYAEGLCRNPWVFNIDADEVVTDNLAAEIRKLFTDGTPDAAAYNTRILTVYPGHDRPRPLANDYNVVRLYHRRIGSYSDHPVFDRVEIGNCKPRQLNGPIHHHSCTSIDHAVEKAMRFSAFRASTTKSRSRKTLLARLAFEGPLTFLKFYVGRRHITGGWQGFYFSLVGAFMRTTRIARLLETR